MVAAREERPRGWGPDIENRLTSVTGNGTTTFFYDGDGARVKKVDATGTTAYVGSVEVLLTGTLRITKTYYSATGLVAMRVVTSTGGNTLCSLHTEQLVCHRCATPTFCIDGEHSARFDRSCIASEIPRCSRECGYENSEMVMI